MRARLPRRPNWLPAVLYALALHAVIIALLVVGFRIVSEDEAPGEAIQATIVREPPEAKPEPAPEPKPDPEELKRELERQQQEAEARRLEQERKEQDAERLRVEAERKKQEVEKQRQLEEEKKRKEEEEKRKQEALRKQEQAEKRKRDEERKKAEQQRQQQTEQTLQQQLEAEEKARAAARAARRSPEAEKYKAAIRQRVERHWVPPGSSRKDLQCTVRVRLIPGGEVLEATVVRSSGDPVFDRSVENAVRKASPLPLPDDPTLFEDFREIEFIFRPQA